MRLERIKLAGFKSFVDPTTVPMPSNLVGIVGPNGCGKSNVIDAVRWVMGESSPKTLRGESMADVIFNGSSARKPVGTATIELVFDNNDGKAGGQYAQYSQISVRRQVSRDGQSSYFLNGVRCRRRDITDLFLGTGLGPRSYAIIEQGMISRLIEARPEELRIFLEEAAGISKYKERRRETENRIRHTRDNLDRLNDLRDEVAKQLQHLKRQASTAEQYQKLKEEERRLRAELLALRWRTLDEETQVQNQTVGRQETELEAAVASQRRLEAQIEQDRQKYNDASEQLNEVQGRYYAQGAEIARLEQAIQFAKDTRQQYEQDLAQLTEAQQEAEIHHQQDRRRQQELAESLSVELPRLTQAQAAEQASKEQLDAAEQAMHAWQETWETFNQRAAEPAQTAQVERTRITHLEQQQENLKRRLQRFDEEFDRLVDSRLDDEIAVLEAEEGAHQEQVQAHQLGLEEIIDRLRAIRDTAERQSEDLDHSRAELQSAKGRTASLEALQQAALGKQQSDGVAQWLDAQGLTGAVRLAEQIEVEEPWRSAAEQVLGLHLQAVCVDNLDKLSDNLRSLASGNLTLLEKGLDKGETNEKQNLLQADSLVSHVRSSLALDGLLDNVYCAETGEQALEMRHELPGFGSVVTPDGLWLGSNWMRLMRGEDERSGVLAREQELKELHEFIQGLSKTTDELAKSLEQNRALQQTLEHTREQRQAELDGVNRTLSEARSVLSSKRTRSDHLRQRRAHILQEKDEIGAQQEQTTLDLTQGRSKLHAALEQMEHLSERREALVAERDNLRERLNSAREAYHQRRDLAHEIALKVESMTSSQTSLKESLERTQRQLRHLNERRDELEKSIVEGKVPIQENQDQLQMQLSRRVEVDAELAAVRKTLEAIDQSLRQKDQERSEAEKKTQSVRERLEQSRIRHQEVSVRARTLEEQLKESGFKAADLFAAIAEDANEREWQAQVDKVSARIQRLGPINLAAIDEFAEQSERMAYLDSQYVDISESLDTLESVIRKIDQETRARFKETFDKVNSGLQSLFPKLFGGGHSYLELTGEDLLDTGVTVMARPPGKRNSSIHLLSGGEKALTAVALVFSIFQLNPAPFCMLDEVDAPLDDANVGRYCKLVEAMSEKIQFIFITHNKVTMQIAVHLTGVTMNEPGVSRLVSVDVDEAARLAAV